MTLRSGTIDGLKLAVTNADIKDVAREFLTSLFLQWQKQYREFSKTSFGQATFLAGVFLLFYTGIAFKILNLVFILWWLAPFLFLLISKVNPQVLSSLVN